jgi:hypothetical protein
MRREKPAALALMNEWRFPFASLGRVHWSHLQKTLRGYLRRIEEREAGPRREMRPKELLREMRPTAPRELACLQQWSERAGYWLTNFLPRSLAESSITTHSRCYSQSDAL